MTHIQKMAPGPPVRMAPEAPTILPVPTWAAMAVASAWKEVMPLFWALPLRLGSALAVIYAVGLTLLAFLFITPLRVPKPGLKGILCMILLGAAELYLMLYGAMPL